MPSCISNGYEYYTFSRNTSLASSSVPERKRRDAKFLFRDFHRRRLLVNVALSTKEVGSMGSWSRALLIAVNVMLLLPSVAGFVICIRLMWLRPRPGDVTYQHLRKRMTFAVLLLGVLEALLVSQLDLGVAGLITKQALYFAIAFQAVPRCSRLVRSL